MWRRRTSWCSQALDASQSGECWGRRRNATSLLLLSGSQNWRANIKTSLWFTVNQGKQDALLLPSDVTNKAQSKQIMAIYYSWIFPPNPLLFLTTGRAGAEPQACMGTPEESRSPARRKVNSSHFLHDKFTTCCRAILLLAFVSPWGPIYSFLAAIKQRLHFTSESLYHWGRRKLLNYLQCVKSWIQTRHWS